MENSILSITPEIQIPRSEFVLTYARSSGPGGQNVNKVNSKAILHWNIGSSTHLTEEIKNKLFKRLRNRINDLGEMVISSDKFRDQIRNREDCFERLVQLIAEASIDPKRRKKTKPSLRSKLKIQVDKTKHSIKKKLRKSSRTSEF